jgi:host factor-I protein
MPAPESRSVEPNIQDAFFRHVCRDKVTVTVRMMDGSEIEGRVTHFDRYAVVVDHAGADHLIFKHAIASITTPQPIGDAFTGPSRA